MVAKPLRTVRVVAPPIAIHRAVEIATRRDEHAARKPLRERAVPHAIDVALLLCLVLSAPRRCEAVLNPVVPARHPRDGTGSIEAGPRALTLAVHVGLLVMSAGIPVDPATVLDVVEPL